MAPLANTSADQIFEALDILARAGDPVGVAELARDMGLPTSTAHRLLVTLIDAGLADRDTTGTRYELGPQAFALVHALVREYPVRNLARPLLERAVSESGETAALDVRVGWLSVRMAGVEGSLEIHAATRLGQTVPLATSASGLVMLAGLDPAHIQAYLSWAGTGKRVAASDLQAKLIAIAELGYAEVRDDSNGGAQLAFPVRAGGRTIAAICLDGSGPAASPTKRTLSRCQGFARELGAQVERVPAAGRDPFAHIDDDALSRLVQIQVGRR